MPYGVGDRLGEVRVEWIWVLVSWVSIGSRKRVRWLRKEKKRVRKTWDLRDEGVEERTLLILNGFILALSKRLFLLELR